MPIFRQKPVEIEAVQRDGQNYAELRRDERVELESLRERVAEQRKHIKVLTEKHEAGNRRARKKIERLQQIIGKRDLFLEGKNDTIRYFTEHELEVAAQVETLREALRVARNWITDGSEDASHLLDLIDAALEGASDAHSS